MSTHNLAPETNGQGRCPEITGKKRPNMRLQYGTGTIRESQWFWLLGGLQPGAAHPCLFRPDNGPPCSAELQAPQARGGSSQVSW